MTGREEISRLVDSWIMERLNRTLQIRSDDTVVFEYGVTSNGKGQPHAGLQELKRELFQLCVQAIGQAFLRAPDVRG